MERYVEYKDSGIDWMGETPCSWNIRPLKAYSVIGDGLHGTPEFDDNGTYFFINGNNLGQRKIQIYDDTKSVNYDEFVKYRLGLDEKTLLISLNGTIGNTSFYNNEKVVLGKSAGYIKLLRVGVNLQFLYYYLQSYGVGLAFALSFASTTINNLSLNALRNLKVAIPSDLEQRMIIAYLDRHTAEIDTLLADLQSQTEMLDRYKRELIAYTLLKGIDKSAAMKDSGVDWIGDIPAAWDLLPLYAVVTENNVKNGGMVCDNLLSLSYGRIITKDIDSTFGLLPESFEGYQIVQPGYTVLRLTDLQNDKRSLRTGYVRETGIITSAYMGLIPGERLDSKYFTYLLHAYDLLKIYYGLGSGLRQSLKFSDMKRLPVLIPPMPEQRHIAEFIESKTAKIEGLIADIMAQIEKLKQYRQIVIHDAVTGKIKVTEG